MFEYQKAFSGFSVNDKQKAKAFYGETLGVNVEETAEGTKLHLNGEDPVFMYEKSDHVPATYTMLNFVVANIDEAVKTLKDKGVTFEHYDNMTDEQGIARGRAINRGPDIAWFKDPAGNILSVLQDS